MTIFGIGSFLAVESVFVFLVSSAVAGDFECIREMVIMAASAIEPSAQFMIDFAFLFISSFASFLPAAQTKVAGFPLILRKSIGSFECFAGAVKKNFAPRCAEGFGKFAGGVCFYRLEVLCGQGGVMEVWICGFAW